MQDDVAAGTPIWARHENICHVCLSETHRFLSFGKQTYYYPHHWRFAAGEASKSSPAHSYGVMCGKMVWKWLHWCPDQLALGDAKWLIIWNDAKSESECAAAFALVCHNNECSSSCQSVTHSSSRSSRGLPTCSKIVILFSAEEPWRNSFGCFSELCIYSQYKVMSRLKYIEWSNIWILLKCF